MLLRVDLRLVKMECMPPIPHPRGFVLVCHSAGPTPLSEVSLTALALIMEASDVTGNGLGLLAAQLKPFIFIPVHQKFFF